jgi:hypothetical protein
MRSGWHNVPVIEGAEQPPGADFSASDVRVVVDATESSLTADLIRAYPPTGLTSWRRTASLDRVARCIRIRDAWTGATTGTTPVTAGDVQVRMLVAGTVTLGEGSARVIPLDGAPPVIITWPPAVTAAAIVQPLEDPLLSTVWGSHLTRLDLNASGREELVVTVEMDTAMVEDF